MIPVWLVALLVGLSVDWVFIFFSIFHGMDDYLVLAKESGSSLRIRVQARPEEVEELLLLLLLVAVVPGEEQ